MKLRGAIDGLGLEYPYLQDCKREAIEVLSKLAERDRKRGEGRCEKR